MYLLCMYLMIAHLFPIRIVMLWKAKSFWTRFDLHTPKFDTFCFLMSNALKWSMVSMVSAVTSSFLELVGIPLRSYTCDGTPMQKFRQSFIPAQNKKHHQKKTPGSTTGNIAGWCWLENGPRIEDVYLYISFLKMGIFQPAMLVYQRVTPKSLPRSQVRINDLAAPPEPINPLMCRCHLKRRGFGLCKTLVQPGGWTKILKHRINSGQGFRIDSWKVWVRLMKVI